MQPGLRDAEGVRPEASTDGPASWAPLCPACLEGNSTPSRHWLVSEQPRVTTGEEQEALIQREP